jgi:type II secretory pathway component PulF
MAAKIRLSSKDRLNLFTDVATMLTAGIPLLEAVESLESDAKGHVRKVLLILKQMLSNGEPLSAGMERLPDAFDPITVNLVRAAEAGGTLEDTLKDIVITTRKEVAFADSLRTTMIYPAFVMVVFTGIVVLMLTFVIPRVAKVFSTMHVHMPAITRAMIAASAFFVHYWLFVVIAILAIIVSFAVIVATKKRAIVRLILSLPGLRTLGRNIDLTRLTRSFGLLLHAGVPLDEALILTKRVVQKKQVLAALSQMQANLETGKALSDGLREQKGIIPPMMSRSIETAEASGTLEETMQNLAEYFDGQVNEQLKVISSLLEPVLLVVVGIMVGTLMITIIAPIYNLISQISPKQ